MQRPATIVVLTAAALTLAACSNAPAPASSASTAAISASTPTIAPATTTGAPAPSATAGALPGDRVDTRHYKIAIDLPNLPADAGALGKTLRANADQAKREFVGNLPAPAQASAFADRQFSLYLDYKIAALTPAFISVGAHGEEDTGGAHPIPIENTFVLDRAAGKIVTLDDLFTQPDAARKALANVAHDTLLKKFLANAPTPTDGSSPQAIEQWRANMTQMLNDGTRPSAINYSLFVVRAGATAGAASPGITLVFPPYQVAPYVDGTQRVEIPAKVFESFLKPGYRGAFADR